MSFSRLLIHVSDNYPLQWRSSVCHNKLIFFTDLSGEKKVELIHDISTATKNISDWKSHIVGAVAQDSCRLNFLEHIKEGEVEMIMDWGIKFLPLMYREKPSELFAQKGLNWHVIVCTYQ